MSQSGDRRESFEIPRSSSFLLPAHRKSWVPNTSKDYSLCLLEYWRHEGERARKQLKGMFAQSHLQNLGIQWPLSLGISNYKFKSAPSLHSSHKGYCTKPFQWLIHWIVYTVLLSWDTCWICFSLKFCWHAQTVNLRLKLIESAVRQDQVLLPRCFDPRINDCTNNSKAVIT